MTEVQTRVGPGRDVRVSDLPIKGHERLFRERVPLDLERRKQIRLTDPWDYGSLAEGVEAWGFRAMQGHRTFMDRAEVARLWFDEDYKPVTEMLDAAELVERGETETDAYMRDRRRRATCCCARTSGPTRCSSGCARPSGTRKRRTRMPPKRRRSKRPPY